MLVADRTSSGVTPQQVAHDGQLSRTDSKFVNEVGCGFVVWWFQQQTRDQQVTGSTLTHCVVEYSHMRANRAYVPPVSITTQHDLVLKKALTLI